MATKVEQTSFDLLGKRWSALIVQDLIGGSRRFRELLGDLVRINDKVLSQRLKELDERGIIERRLFAEVPVRVEYTLTDKGRGLAGVIHAMEKWDADWSEDEPRSTNGKGNGHGHGHGHAGNSSNGMDVLASAPAEEATAAVPESTLPVEPPKAEAPPTEAAFEPEPEPPQPEAAEPVDAKGGKSFWKRLGR